MSERTLDETAQSFYGPKPDDSKVKTVDEPRETLFDRAAESFYGDTAYQDIELVPDDVTRTTAEIEAGNRAWRAGLKAIEASDSDARTITALVKLHGRTPPDDATTDAWHRETSTRLTRAFGADGARVRLAEVRALLNQSPTLKKAIADSKLADHPGLVWLLTERARTQRNAGKLTGKPRG